MSSLIADHIYSANRDDVLPYLPDGVKSILDVGCGAGVFGASVRKKLPDVYYAGVEPSIEAASCASQVLNDVHVGFFDDSFKSSCSYDLIIMNDVLEHMPSPEKALKKALKILNPEGVLLASIPNIRHIGQVYQYLVNKDWHYQETGLMDYTHLRFFTKKSILRLFQTQGFQVEMIDGINASPALTRKFFFMLVDALSFGWSSDMKFYQFIVRAKKDMVSE